MSPEIARGGHKLFARMGPSTHPFRRRSAVLAPLSDSSSRDAARGAKCRSSAPYFHTAGHRMAYSIGRIIAVRNGQWAPKSRVMVRQRQSHHSEFGVSGCVGELRFRIHSQQRARTFR